MILRQIFDPKAVIVNLQSEDKNSVFEEMITKLVSANPEIDYDKALTAVKERESKMSTGIQHSIGVPHGRTDAVSGVKGVIGISQKGIDYDALDGAPVNLVFMILSAPDASEDHLVAIQRLAQVLMDPDFSNALLEVTDPQSVYDVVCRFEDGL